MEEIRNSALLDQIMKCAYELCKKNECSGLTREYIVIAAMTVLDAAKTPDQDAEEYSKTKELLSNLSREEGLIRGVIQAWQKKSIPSKEGILLSAARGNSISAARRSSRKEVTADLYLAEILKNTTPGIAALQQKQPDAENQPAPQPSAAEARTQQPTPQTPAPSAQEKTAGNEKAAAQDEGPLDLKAAVAAAKKLQSALLDTVLGQQQAVSIFTAGYFQAILQAGIAKERKSPRATFLFAGPPGMGKTLLSESAADALGLPKKRFNMSEFIGSEDVDELLGSDGKFAGSREGSLTEFVRKNPRCVLIFDEIEKTCRSVIHLFLQILDEGVLRDKRTKEEVRFRDTILFFTTNAGKQLYENSDVKNLSVLPRDVILDALAKDVNPMTGQPYFPSSLCSRFAAGNVIMFNRLEADTLQAIVRRTLEKQAGDLKDAMGIDLKIDRDVTTALLLAEGAAADARTVRSRAHTFFGGELYELFRLVSSKNNPTDVESIRSIRVSVNRENERPEVAELFSPSQRVHALAYLRSPLSLPGDDPRLPEIHYVKNLEEGYQVMAEENVQLALCDLFGRETGAGKQYLNLEDRASEARSFLRAMLRQYPNLAIVLVEPEGYAFTEEEKTSYLRSGVRGFLSLDGSGLADRIAAYTESIFQQNTMVKLARSNQLLRFETAQTVDAAGKTAEIILFDMRLEKAIKAEDAGNVLSLLSTPDVKFDQVIGAEDAKNELQFFVNYMKQPQKYRRAGLDSPKGVLLYGPPGTGKTMLAKAFAAASGATFIALAGNQFFKKYVGTGPEMMNQIFASARKYAPAVIFIDEIDTIGRQRTGRDTDMAQDSEQILTALFAQMDGFMSYADKPVFVLGATNYGVDPGSPMSLDPAFLRRFDRHILVDLPTLESRKKYLVRETKDRSAFRLSQGDIDSLADRSAGMSLAQLASVLNLALKTAMQKQQDHVDGAMLEEAFEKINSGESRTWSPEITLRTARHEAGHALLGWLLGQKPSFVTIVSRGDHGGYTQYASQEDRMGYTRQELLDKIRIALGGRAAEIVCYGDEDGVSTGASGDLQSATVTAERFLCRFGMDEEFGLAVIERVNGALPENVQKQINLILKEQMHEAVRCLRENRAKLDALVDGLIRSTSLRAPDIDSIMNGVV